MLNVKEQLDQDDLEAVLLAYDCEMVRKNNGLSFSQDAIDSCQLWLWHYNTGRTENYYDHP